MNQDKRKPDDLALAAMAALAHWHANSRNFHRREPAYLKLLRTALENRGFMPYQLSQHRLDFDELVADAIKKAA